MSIRRCVTCILTNAISFAVDLLSVNRLTDNDYGLIELNHFTPENPRDIQAFAWKQ